MGKLVDDLLSYLSNISDEQLKKDWYELEEFNNIGPEVTNFINQTQENVQGYNFSSELTISSEFKNPEITLDFFYLAS